MMKRIGFFGVMFGMLCIAGCRGTVTVDGNHYSMLRQSEIDELKAIARATLKHNQDKAQIVTAEECRRAMATEPAVKIEYFGDLAGNARFTWDFPERRTTVLIRGEFLNSKKRLVAVGIDPVRPKVIDTTHKLPENAPIVNEK